MKRLAAATLVVLASLGIEARADAQATSLLTFDDATELAALLAEATEAQGICYGWDVVVTDEGYGNSVSDFGSNLGPGVDATNTEACPKYVVFHAEIVYTSESSESEDSSFFDIVTNLAQAPEDYHLVNAGINDDRLLGSNDDLAVIDAASALPLLMGELGYAPALPLEANQDALPDGDGATNTPGSDWMRKNGALVFVGALCVGVAIVWALLARFRPTWIGEVTEVLSNGD